MIERPGATPPERRRLSRRGILTLAAASVTAACTTAAYAGDTRPGGRRRLVSPLPDRSGAAAVPTPSPTPSPSATVSPQAEPVFTLAEYREQVPGPDFPANAVALTIDDGPHPVWTPKILDLLE